MHFDIFNGDADGIIALHQLRLAERLNSELLTGVKRDIGLLAKIPSTSGDGDTVTALDIAMEKNAEPLVALLARGVRVTWFDHHNPGPIPGHHGLEAHVDTSAEICTSMLVDRHLGGAYRAWSVAAAYGDNLTAVADELAVSLGYGQAHCAALKELGECLNYNAYGDTVADLHFHPADLYRSLHSYVDPFEFVSDAPEFVALRQGYLQDMDLARSCRPVEERERGAVFLLPDAPWARRVSGVFANELASSNPARAHALATRSPRGHLVVSVRSPLANRVGADTLCARFATGGGRKAAAGINSLPEDRFAEFTTAFFDTFGN